MIYRKEQRANVAAEKNTCDNAVMNKILGERVSVVYEVIEDIAAV